MSDIVIGRPGPQTTQQPTSDGATARPTGPNTGSPVRPDEPNSNRGPELPHEMRGPARERDGIDDVPARALPRATPNPSLQLQPPADRHYRHR